MTYPAQRAFLGASALLFAASAAVTIAWCGSMSSMAGMPMPGEWSMSMAWMRMPGQSWVATGGTFLGMWVAMMVAMMLPSLVPMLSRYRRVVVSTGERRLNRLTTLVGLGYFSVWTAFGVLVFPLGVVLATMTMRVPALARAVPIATAIVVLIAGALQFSAWKARQLACCRGASGAISVPRRRDVGTVWHYGLQLGLRCIYCCAGLTAILLVMGVMNLRVMAIVAGAITLERLAPAGRDVARALGMVIVVFGSFLLMRAVGIA